MNESEKSPVTPLSEFLKNPRMLVTILLLIATLSGASEAMRWFASLEETPSTLSSEKESFSSIPFEKLHFQEEDGDTITFSPDFQLILKGIPQKSTDTYTHNGYTFLQTEDTLSGKTQEIDMPFNFPWDFGGVTLSTDNKYAIGFGSRLLPQMTEKQKQNADYYRQNPQEVTDGQSYLITYDIAENRYNSLSWDEFLQGIKNSTKGKFELKTDSIDQTNIYINWLDKSRFTINFIATKESDKGLENYNGSLIFNAETQSFEGLIDTQEIVSIYPGIYSAAPGVFVASNEDSTAIKIGKLQGTTLSVLQKNIPSNYGASGVLVNPQGSIFAVEHPESIYTPIEMVDEKGASQIFHPYKYQFFDSENVQKIFDLEVVAPSESSKLENILPNGNLIFADIGLERIRLLLINPQTRMYQERILPPSILGLSDNPDEGPSIYDYSFYSFANKDQLILETYPRNSDGDEGTPQYFRFSLATLFAEQPTLPTADLKKIPTPTDSSLEATP